MIDCRKIILLLFVLVLFSSFVSADIAVVDDSGNVVDVIDADLVDVFATIDYEQIDTRAGNVEARERISGEGICQPIVNSKGKKIGAQSGNNRFKNVCMFRPDYLSNPDFFDEEFEYGFGAAFRPEGTPRGHPEVLHKFSCSEDGGVLSEIVRCSCGYQDASNIGTCSEIDELPYLIGGSDKTLTNERVIKGNKPETLDHNSIILETDIEFVRDLDKSTVVNVDIKPHHKVHQHSTNYPIGSHQFLQIGEYDKFSSYKVTLPPGSEPFKGLDNFKSGETYSVVFKEHLDGTQPIYNSDFSAFRDDFYIDTSYRKKIPRDIGVKIANHNAREAYLSGVYDTAPPLYLGERFRYEGLAYTYQGLVQKEDVFELTFSTSAGEVKAHMTLKDDTEFGEAFIDVANKLIYIESVGSPKKDDSIFIYLPRVEDHDPDDVSTSVPFVPPTGDVIYIRGSSGRNPVSILDASQLYVSELPIGPKGNLLKVQTQPQYGSNNPPCHTRTSCYENSQGFPEDFTSQEACPTQFIIHTYLCEDCSSKSCKIPPDNVIEVDESLETLDRRDVHIVRKKITFVKANSPVVNKRYDKTQITEFGKRERLYLIKIFIDGKEYTIIYDKVPLYNYKGQIYSDYSWIPYIAQDHISASYLKYDIVAEVRKLFIPPDPYDETDPRNDPDYDPNALISGQVPSKDKDGKYSLQDLRDLLLGSDNVASTDSPDFVEPEYTEFIDLYADLVKEAKYEEIKSLYKDNPDKFFEPIEEAAKAIAGDLDTNIDDDLSIVSVTEKSSLTREEKDAIISLITSLGSSTQTKNVLAKMTDTMWFNIMSNEPVREIIGQENLNKIIEEKETISALHASILIDYSRPPDIVLIIEDKKLDHFQQYDIKSAADFFQTKIHHSSYPEWVKTVWDKALNEMLLINSREWPIIEGLKKEEASVLLNRYTDATLAREGALSWMAANLNCGGPLLATTIYSIVDTASGHDENSPHNTLNLIKDQRSYQIWFGDDGKEYPWHEQAFARMGVCGYLALGAVSAQAGTMGRLGKVVLGTELALDSSEAVSLYSTYMGSSEFKKEVQPWMIMLGTVAVFLDIPGLIAPMEQSVKIAAKLNRAAKNNGVAAVEIWESAVKEGLASKNSEGLYEVVMGNRQKFDDLIEEISFGGSTGTAKAASQEVPFYADAISGQRAISSLPNQVKKGNLVVFEGVEDGSGATLTHIGKVNGPRSVSFETAAAHYRHASHLKKGDVLAYATKVEEKLLSKGSSASQTIAHLDNDGYLTYILGGSNKLFKVSRDGTVTEIEALHRALGQQSVIGDYIPTVDKLSVGDSIVSISEGVVDGLAREGKDIKDILRNKAGKSSDVIEAAISKRAGKNQVADESVAVMTYKGKTRRPYPSTPIIPGTARHGDALKPGLLQSNPDFQAEVLEEMLKIAQNAPGHPRLSSAVSRINKLIRKNDLARIGKGDMPRVGLYSHSTVMGSKGGIFSSGSPGALKIIKDGQLKKHHGRQGFGAFLSTRIEDQQFGPISFVFTESIEKIPEFKAHGLLESGTGTWYKIDAKEGTVPIVGEKAIEFDNLAYITYTKAAEGEALRKALEDEGFTAIEALELVVRKDTAKLMQEFLHEALNKVNPAKQIKRGHFSPVKRVDTFASFKHLGLSDTELIDLLLEGEIVYYGERLSIVLIKDGKKVLRDFGGSSIPLQFTGTGTLSLTNKALHAEDLIKLKNGEVEFANVIAKGDLAILPPLDDVAGRNALQRAVKPGAKVLTHSDLVERWGGDTLELDIGGVSNSRGATKSLDPERTTYGPDGRPLKLTYRAGEKVKLMRFVVADSRAAAEVIAAQKQAYSKMLNDVRNELKVQGLSAAEIDEVAVGIAKERAARLFGTDLNIEEVMRNTWQGGGNVGIPTSYADNIWHIDLQGQPVANLILEVPAEYIVHVRSVNGELVFPKGFDLDRPDIDKFGFVNPETYEGEITFLYEIPPEYVKKVIVSKPYSQYVEDSLLEYLLSAKTAELSPEEAVVILEELGAFRKTIQDSFVPGRPTNFPDHVASISELSVAERRQMIEQIVEIEDLVKTSGQIFKRNLKANTLVTEEEMIEAFGKALKPNDPNMVPFIGGAQKISARYTAPDGAKYIVQELKFTSVIPLAEEIAARRLINELGMSQFKVPEAIGYKGANGKYYLISKDTLALEDADAWLSMSKQQRAELSAFAYTFGIKDLNEGNFLFDEFNTYWIDFIQSFKKIANVAPDSLDGARQAYKGQALGIFQGPYVSKTSLNDIEDYLEEINRWKAKVNDPSFDSKFRQTLADAGYPPNKIDEAVTNIKENARNLEKNIRDRLDITNAAISASKKTIDLSSHVRSNLKAINNFIKNSQELVLSEGEIFVYHYTPISNLDNILSAKGLSATQSVGGSLKTGHFNTDLQILLEELLPDIPFDRTRSVYTFLEPVGSPGLNLNVDLKVKIRIEDAHVQDNALADQAWHEYAGSYGSTSITRETAEKLSESTTDLTDLIENYEKGSDGIHYKKNSAPEQKIEKPEILIPKDIPLGNININGIPKGVSDLLKKYNVRDIDELLLKSYTSLDSFLGGADYLRIYTGELNLAGTRVFEDTISTHYRGLSYEGVGGLEAIVAKATDDISLEEAREAVLRNIITLQDIDQIDNVPRVMEQLSDESGRAIGYLIRDTGDLRIDPKVTSLTFSQKRQYETVLWDAHNQGITLGDPKNGFALDSNGNLRFDDWSNGVNRKIDRDITDEQFEILKQEDLNLLAAAGG